MAALTDAVLRRQQRRFSLLVSRAFSKSGFHYAIIMAKINHDNSVSAISIGNLKKEKSLT